MGESKKKEQVERWADSTAPILRAVRERGESDLIGQNFCIPGDGSNYLHALSHFYNALDAPNTPEYPLKPCGCSESEVMSVIVGEIQNGRASLSLAKAICMVRELGVDWDWRMIVEVLENCIEEWASILKQDEVSKSVSVGLLGTILVLVFRLDAEGADDLLRENTMIYQTALYLHKLNPTAASFGLITSLASGGPEKQGSEMDIQNQGAEIVQEMTEFPNKHYNQLTELSSVCKLAGINLTDLEQRTDVDLDQLRNYVSFV